MNSTGHRKLTAAAAALFVLLAAVYAFTMQGVRLGADELGMYLVTESLARDGDVFIDAQWQQRVALAPCRDGQLCARFPIGQSLVQMPLYAVGSIVDREASSPAVFGPGSMRYLVTSLTGPLLAAGAAVFVLLMCVRLGAGLRWSVFLALLFGLGTPAWAYGKSLMSEPLQTFCLAGCAYFLLLFGDRGRLRDALLAGVFAGTMIVAKFFLAVLLPVLAIYLLAVRRAKQDAPGALPSLGCFLAPVAAGAAVVLWYNFARFADPMEFGYYLLNDRDALHRFNVPLWSGLHGLLFSPGKGIFWYAPAAGAAVAAFGAFMRRRANEAFLCAGVFVTLAVAYAGWNQWHGDFAWGPRFLAPALPLLVLPLCTLERDWLVRRPGLRAALLALLFFVSLFVQVLGATVKTGAYLAVAKTQVPYQILYAPGDITLRDDLLNQHFIPEFSPLAAHWWMLKHTALHRNNPPAELRELMQRDAPWLGLIRNGAPQDPTPCAGWDFWHAYFKQYLPQSRGWVQPLAALLGVVIAAAACAILMVVLKSRE